MMDWSTIIGAALGVLGGGFGRALVETISKRENNLWKRMGALEHENELLRKQLHKKSGLLNHFVLMIVALRGEVNDVCSEANKPERYKPPLHAGLLEAERDIVTQPEQELSDESQFDVKQN